MIAVATVALLVGKLVPNLGEPVPFVRWRPARPTFEQVIWGAIRRHRTRSLNSSSSVHRLLKQLFSRNRGKR